MEKPTFSWINEKLMLRESEVEGDGMFAVQDVAKDEILIVQGGRCLHIDQIDALNMDTYSYLGFQVEEQIYIFPIFSEGEPLHDGIFKVNHSCEPNAGFSGQISLVAMRDISAGEEITFDYAMTDIQFDGDIEWEKTECKCGSAGCRKYITGTDWRAPELQEKYNGYFSKHVTEAIKKARSNTNSL